MASVRSIIKDWLPPVASVAAVLLTATYAVTRQSRAAEGIQNASQLAATLTDTATLAAETTRSPQAIQEMADRRTALERRMQDALKPGTVVSALADLAGKASLTVHEIQPKAETGQPSDQTSPVYPAYRILVQGTYAAIAEYMERCKEDSIPARVRELHVFRDRAATGEHPEDGLMAEIVVETFVPANAQKQGAN